jgi:hypothetical protein
MLLSAVEDFEGEFPEDLRDPALHFGVRFSPSSFETGYLQFLATNLFGELKLC